MGPEKYQNIFGYPRIGQTNIWIHFDATEMIKQIFAYIFGSRKSNKYEYKSYLCVIYSNIFGHHCTAIHCTAIHYTALQCTAIHCTKINSTCHLQIIEWYHRRCHIFRLYFGLFDLKGDLYCTLTGRPRDISYLYWSSPLLVFLKSYSYIFQKQISVPVNMGQK